MNVLILKISFGKDLPVKTADNYSKWFEEFPSSAYTHFTSELLRKPINQTKEITISDHQVYKKRMWRLPSV